MTKSKSKLAGWILTGLLALFLAGPSAISKFVEWPGKAEMFDKMGFTTGVMFKIGVLEVIITLLFVIPRTGFLGAILLTGYLGGAIVTHVRIDDPYIMPLIIGVLVWVALALRQPEVLRLAKGSSTA